MLRILAALICTIAIAGCTTLYRSHGYVPSEEDLTQITVGVDSRETVADVVGAPSASGVLNATGFYYVESRVRHFAYRRPEVVEREVLAITFDSNGIVRNIERFGLQDGKVIELQKRVTDNAGESGTFLRQLLNNLGNFSAGDFL